jgi:hypothetical protein
VGEAEHLLWGPVFRRRGGGEALRHRAVEDAGDSGERPARGSGSRDRGSKSPRDHPADHKPTTTKIGQQRPNRRRLRGPCGNLYSRAQDVVVVPGPVHGVRDLDGAARCILTRDPGYGFPRRPLLGDSVNRGNPPPSSRCELLRSLNCRPSPIGASS